MLVVIDHIVIFVSVFDGYVLAGGRLGSLFQPIELPIIFGAGIGAFVIGNDKKAIDATVRALPDLFKGSKYTKALCMEVAALLYVVLFKIRREGVTSIEANIENPCGSVPFVNYLAIQADHHALNFTCDYLRLMIGDNLNLFQVEALMDQEVDTHHHETERPARIITRVGNVMPAFGIMAAVVGMVRTIGSVGLPSAELDKLIVSAPVGTFLGILPAYGFIEPLGPLLEQYAEKLTKLLQCMKVMLLASTSDYVPAIAMEFDRRMLFSAERPSFAELENYVRSAKTV